MCLRSVSTVQMRVSHKRLFLSVTVSYEFITSCVLSASAADVVYTHYHLSVLLLKLDQTPD